MELFNTISKITGEQTAKDIIAFLIDNFNFYITTEELQQLGI